MNLKALEQKASVLTSMIIKLVNLNGIENQFLFDEVPSLKRFFNRPEYLLN